LRVLSCPRSIELPYYWIPRTQVLSSFDHCFYLLVTDRCTLHSTSISGNSVNGLHPTISPLNILASLASLHFRRFTHRGVFFVSPPFHSTVVGCQLTPPSTFLFYSSTIIYIMFPLCKCAGICEFEQDSSLFPNIVSTAEVNAQVERARGVVVTPKLYRNLG
jgi:hypothetical protein